jgi:hypothetical protein
VAECVERLVVSEQIKHIFNMEIFNLKKLNEVEGKEQCHVEISNRLADLENSNAEVDINTALETIRENKKIQPKRVYIVMN